MSRTTKYPKEMKLRAINLKAQGLTVKAVTAQIIKEFPEPGQYLQITANNGETAIRNWLYKKDYEHLRPSRPNNKIDLSDKETEIVDQFKLIPCTSAISDKFVELTQSIPELLAEKREELANIQEQIRQLEEMSKVLDKEIKEEEESASLAA